MSLPVSITRQTYQEAVASRRPEHRGRVLETSCPICLDPFTLNKIVSRLGCDHIFCCFPETGPLSHRCSLCSVLIVGRTPEAALMDELARATLLINILYPEASATGPRAAYSERLVPLQELGEINFNEELLQRVKIISRERTSCLEAILRAEDDEALTTLSTIYATTAVAKLLDMKISLTRVNGSPDTNEEISTAIMHSLLYLASKTIGNGVAFLTSEGLSETHTHKINLFLRDLGRAISNNRDFRDLAILHFVKVKYPLYAPFIPLYMLRKEDTPHETGTLYIESKKMVSILAIIAYIGATYIIKQGLDYPKSPIKIEFLNMDGPILTTMISALAVTIFACNASLSGLCRRYT